MTNTTRDTVRERLYYIDFLAFFTGQVTRRDLVERFGISEPAATKDLAMFIDLAPNMLRYDVRQKCYALASDEPFYEHDVDESLFSLCGGQATSFNSGSIQKLPNWVAASIKRKPDLKLVATLTRAMYQKRVVKCSYYSLDHGEAPPRVLAPLSLVHDGTRWHLRCYSYDKESFRDYVLSRFLDAEVVGASDKNIADDPLWTTRFEMEIVPHPKAHQKQSLKIDYAIEGEALFVSVPLCIAPYFLLNWRVDVTKDASQSPSAYHLYLNNRSAALASGMPKWIFGESD